MITLSIIIPCYNVQKYIERCINSILPQLNDRIEIIAINDGSSDCTSDILDRLSSEISCLKVYSYTNGGLSTARNRGVSIARGRYVWFIDSDDYIIDNAIDILLRVIDSNNNEDVIAFNFFEKHTNGIESIVDYNQGMLSPTEFITNSPRFYAWNKIYSKSIFEHCRFVDGLRNIEDFVFNMMITQYIHQVATIPDILYVYDQTNQDSISNCRTKRHLVRLAQNTYKAHDILIDKLSSISEKVLRDAWMKSLNTSFAGMMFSLFRFYNCRQLRNGVEFYKTRGVYPFKYDGNIRQKACVWVANNKWSWPVIEALKKMILKLID